MSSVRIAIAQRAAAVGTERVDPRPENLATVDSAVAAAQARGAELVVFGEMFLTGLRTDAHLARWAVRPGDPDDEVMRRLRRLCADRDVTVLVGSATHGNRPGAVHNSVILVDESGRSQVVHKRHLARIRLPDGRTADEERFYSAGPAPDVLETKWGRIGLQICYEVTFPEVARASMLAGADLIINCTASISGAEEIWNAMSRARAFENALWFVVASVAGQQADETYFGGSAVVDPHGVVVAQAAYDAEDLLVVDIALDRSRAARHYMNVLSARRPDLYSRLTATER